MCSMSVRYIIQKYWSPTNAQRVLSSIVTYTYMFRPCWVIFRENFFVILTLRLHFIVEWECAVDCVLEAWILCGPGLHAGNAETSRLQKQRSTQSTAHSHSTIKCNLNVKITKSSPWRWPSRVETCRGMLRLMIKLSLCSFWWLVFLYSISVLNFMIDDVLDTNSSSLWLRWFLCVKFNVFQYLDTRWRWCQLICTPTPDMWNHNPYFPKFVTVRVARNEVNTRDIRNVRNIVAGGPEY
jgi:hypothetical protein